MNLSNLYKIAENYDFSSLDICDKDYAIFSIICYIKNISRYKFIQTKNGISFNDKEVDKFKECLDKLIHQKIPLQYILGHVYIYNEDYIVSR